MSHEAPKLGFLIPEGKEAVRDAVHVAVLPVIAGEDLKGHCSLRLGADGKAYSTVTGQGLIGIVDPFLSHWGEITIKKGERFWMFMLPNSVTNLRHTWTHSEFATKPPAVLVSEEESFLAALKKDPYDETTRKVYSDWLDERGRTEEAMEQRAWTKEKQDNISSIAKAKEYLENFAEECGLSYNKLMEAAQDHLSYGSYHTLSFDTPDIAYDMTEFWKAYTLVTGIKPNNDDDSYNGHFIACSC
jgi:uncharacterized protein (TIGR02996 family)